MKHRLFILFLITSLAVVIPLGAFAADENVGQKGLIIEEYYESDDSGWVKVDDDTWTYTFEVDDSLNWYAYEEEVPSGYTTPRTAEDPVAVSDSEASITNKGIEYTVMLDPNGGKVESSPTAIPKKVNMYSTKNNTVSTPDARAGYNFKGWFTAASGGTKVYDDEGKAVIGDYWMQPATPVWRYAGNVTLYAHWTANYSIEYEGLDGAECTSKPTSAVQGTVFTVSNPTKTGFDFLGWDISGMGSVTHQWDSSEGTTNQGNSTSAKGVKATKFNNLTGTGNATITFTAQWAEKTAAGGLKYDANGHGTAPEAQDLYYTKAANIAGTPSDPGMSATGYDFDGWSISKDGTGTKYAAGAEFKKANSLTNTAGTTVIPGVFTVYAVWTPHKYNISYSLAGGSHGSSHPAQASWDSAVTISNPTRAGYDFAGWDISGMDSNTHYWDNDDASTSKSGTTATGVKATKFKNLNATNGQTVTFTAKWTPKTYTIDYDLNGGSHGSSHPTTGTYDTALTIDTPSKSGYVFVGWEITGMDSCKHYWDTASAATERGSATTGNTFRTGATKFKNLRSSAGTVTLSAVWGHYIDLNGKLDGENANNISNYGTADVYINGSKVSTGVSEFKQAWPEGTEWEIKNIQAASGKTYVNGTNLSGTLGSENIDARLVFGTNYTIEYEGLNGATCTTKPTSAVGGQAFTVSNPTHPACNFTGWKITGMDNSSHTYGSETTTETTISSTKATEFKNLRTSAGTVTFTAQWTDKAGKLTYNANGYGTAPEEVDMKYSVEVKAASMSNVTGYTFKGWSRTANGSVEYVANAVFKEANSLKNTKGDTVIPDGDTLYAVWEENTATLTYDANGHGTAPKSVTMKYTGTTKAADAIEDSCHDNAYEFKGWNTKFDGSGDSYAPGETVKAANKEPSNITLYAIWKEPTATLIYHANGHGTAPEPETMSYTAEHNLSSMSDITGEKMSGGTGVAYKFEEWNTKADGTGKHYAAGAKYKDVDTVPESITLYAIWTETTATITYKNGGHGTAPSNAKMKYSAEATAAAALTETGYTFNNWKGSNNKTYNAGAKIKDADIIPEDLTLTAQWTANQYNIAYELNGGSHGSSHPAKGTWDEALTINNPTKVGYEFTGWKITGMDTNTHTYGSDTTNSTSISSTKATSFKNLNATQDATVTFTAQWTPNKYNIEYDANGGALGSQSSKSATYNVAFTVSNPTRKGFYFNGWTISDMSTDCTHYWDNNSATTERGSNASATGVKNTQFKNLRSTTGTVTFTAQWTEMTGVVKYEANGHGTAPADQTVYYTKEAKTPEAIDAVGFSFKEWNTREDGLGKAYAPDTKFKDANSFKNTNSDTIIPDGDTLYAIWEEDSATLTYHNNGHGTTPNATTMLYTKQTKTAKAISAEGYIFKGWNTKANGSGEMYEAEELFKDENSYVDIHEQTVIPDGADLYAIWEEMTAKIEFNRNGHGTGVNPQTMWYSKEFIMPTGVNVEGYTFKEWNTKPTGNGKSYPIGSVYKQANKLTNTAGTTVIPNGSTVYAIWTEVTGTLTYDNNGHGTAPAATTMKYSVETRVEGMDDVNGWIFLGWATTKEKADNEQVDYKAMSVYKNGGRLVNTLNETVLPKGATLYAVWVADEGDLTYDVQGHGKAPSTEHLRYAVETSVADDEMSAKGYIFKEWNTEADGSGHTYNPGDKFKEEHSFKNTNGERVVPGGDTLYAIWIEKTATLTYDLNYDGAERTTTTMKYSKKETTPTTKPTRTGATFKEWNTGRLGKGTSYPAGSVYKDANVEPVESTLFAIWEEKTATVTYDANGHGKAPNADKIFYTKEYVISNSISADGWVFKGWDTKANGTGTRYQVGATYKTANTDPVEVTLYAIWERETHTLTVNANGGEPNATYEMGVNSNDNTSITLPTKDGVTCTGLYSRRIGGTLIYGSNGKITNDGTYFNDGVFIYRDDLILYAQYSEAPVTCVTFDKNCDDEVSDMPADLTKYIGKATTLPSTIPTRKNYTFLYWSTDPQGGGDTYSIQGGSNTVFPKDSDDMYGNYASGPVTLYAIWEENEEDNIAATKLPITYNFYTSDSENGLLDAEMTYTYKNFFQQTKTVKVRRTIFVDSDQEIVPDVIFSKANWHSGDEIPVLARIGKGKPAHQTTPNDTGEDESGEFTIVDSEQSLIKALSEGGTIRIKVKNDITLSEPAVVPANAKVLLQMNGCKITGGFEISGELEVTEGTIESTDKCVIVNEGGVFTADDSVMLKGGTYAVYFASGDVATVVDLNGTSTDTDILCGSENGNSLLVVEGDAKIKTNPSLITDENPGGGLFADFTTDRTNKGLIFTESQTVAKPVNYIDDREYLIIPSYDGYNWAVRNMNNLSTFSIVADTNNDDYGEVEGGGDFLEGKEVTLEATPKEHCEFVRWTNGEETLSTDKKWTFVCTHNTTIIGEFRRVPCTITATTNGFGEIEGTGEKLTDTTWSFGEGEDGRLNAIPSDRYSFIKWIDADTNETVSEDPSFEFTVTKDKRFKAIFEPTNLVLSVETPSIVGTDVIDITFNGEPLEEGTTTLDYKAPVTLKATINQEGYSVNGWYVDGHKVCDEATYSFNIEEDTYLSLVLDVDDDEASRLINEFKENQKLRVQSEFTTYKEELYEKIQPIGSVYSSTSPMFNKGNGDIDEGVIRVQDTFGGKWERIENTFLYASGEKELGETGGRRKYNLTLAMSADENGLAFIMDTLQNGSLEDKFKLKHSLEGEVAGGDVVISNTDTAESDIMPPYQAVNMFRRIDEFEGMSNLKSGLYASKPSDDIIAPGYVVKTLTEEDEEYAQGYRYAVVSEFDGIEEGSLTGGFFVTRPPAELIVNGYMAVELETDHPAYEEGYRYEVRVDESSLPEHNDEEG